MRGMSDRRSSAGHFRHMQTGYASGVSILRWLNPDQHVIVITLLSEGNNLR
jgi:hypothetical protein